MSKRTMDNQTGNEIRRLHIGGKLASPGWEVLNANPASFVDHVGNANDLSRFEEGTFLEIYASHVLEHLDYREEIHQTLVEWRRVLVPGGRVYLSVPDLDVLARLFLDREGLSFEERFRVMRMMFGGHVDEFDYHQVGLNDEILGNYLRKAGFSGIRKVPSFGIFADTSELQFKDVAISLNMMAEKPQVDDTMDSAEGASSFRKNGDDLAAAGRTSEAIEQYQKALAIDPANFGVLVNLGNMFKAEGRNGPAEESYRKALAVSPDHPAVLNNLGCLLKDGGKITEALEFLRRVANNGDSTEMSRINAPIAHSNLLLTLNYSEEGRESIFEEHRRWGARYANSLEDRSAAREISREPERKLRIGYISGDFYSHSVAYFFEPLLANHDRSAFEVICYSTRTRSDGMTEQLKSLSDHWRDISRLNDDQAADLIRSDEVDILVDLSGHTSGHRLLVFARRPAPIQVSYLGYPNTSGMESIDYRFTDARADPPGESDSLYTEELIRLSHGFLCYHPPEDCPDLGKKAPLEAGRVTFGSFNHQAKINHRLIESWAGLLRALPGAGLLIKAKPLGEPEVRRELLDSFSRLGVDSNRIELHGRIPSRSDHLALYDRVDVALDTFPYNGTTTTCEALWMGVPVISRVGNCHASRVGLSLLSSLGLEDLVGQSWEEYESIAIDLANSPERREALRTGLRQRMADSPLMNPTLITNTIEQAYREMWRCWCEKQSV